MKQSWRVVTSNPQLTLRRIAVVGLFEVTGVGKDGDGSCASFLRLSLRAALAVKVEIASCSSRRSHTGWPNDLDITKDLRGRASNSKGRQLCPLNCKAVRNATTDNFCRNHSSGASRSFRSVG